MSSIFFPSKNKKSTSFWNPIAIKSVKPFFSPKFIQPVKLKSYPTRTKQENKLINKNPFGDKDKDRVPNIFDCKPLDKNKQGKMDRLQIMKRAFGPVVRKWERKNIDLVSLGRVQDQPFKKRFKRYWKKETIDNKKEYIKNVGITSNMNITPNQIIRFYEKNRDLIKYIPKNAIRVDFKGNEMRPETKGFYSHKKKEIVYRKEPEDPDIQSSIKHEVKHVLDDWSGKSKKEFEKDYAKVTKKSFLSKIPSEIKATVIKRTFPELILEEKERKERYLKKHPNKILKPIVDKELSGLYNIEDEVILLEDVPKKYKQDVLKYISKSGRYDYFNDELKSKEGPQEIEIPKMNIPLSDLRRIIYKKMKEDKIEKITSQELTQREISKLLPKVFDRLSKEKKNPKYYLYNAFLPWEKRRNEKSAIKFQNTPTNYEAAKFEASILSQNKKGPEALPFLIELRNPYRSDVVNREEGVKALIKAKRAISKVVPKIDISSPEKFKKAKKMYYTKEDNRNYLEELAIHQEYEKQTKEEELRKAYEASKSGLSFLQTLKIHPYEEDSVFKQLDDFIHKNNTATSSKTRNEAARLALLKKRNKEFFSANDPFDNLGQFIKSQKEVGDLTQSFSDKKNAQDIVTEVYEDDISYPARNESTEPLEDDISYPARNESTEPLEDYVEDYESSAQKLIDESNDEE